MDKCAAVIGAHSCGLIQLRAFQSVEAAEAEILELVWMSTTSLHGSTTLHAVERLVGRLSGMLVAKT